MYDVIQMLGWLGGTLVILGRLLIARKVKMGFPVAVTSSILVGTQAVLMDNWGIVVMSAMLFCIDLYGWFFWSKRKEENNGQ